MIWPFGPNRVRFARFARRDVATHLARALHGRLYRMPASKGPWDATTYMACADLIGDYTTTQHTESYIAMMVHHAHYHARPVPSDLALDGMLRFSDCA
jgi:hypothetical protein